MKNICIALLKAVCCTVVFVLCQIAGSFLAALGYTVAVGWQAYAATGTLSVVALQSAASAFIEAHAVPITAFGDLLAVGVLWVYFRLRGKRLVRETAWKRLPFGWLWPAVLCGACCSFALSLAFALLPIPESALESYVQASAGLAEPGAVAFVCVALLAPMAEEVVFRGLVYTRLRSALPRALAAILAAAAFALIHGNLLWMAYAFVLALVITFIYEKTGSLWASIGFHVAFNACGAYVQPYVQTLGAGWWVFTLMAASAGAIALLWRISRLDKTAEQGLY